METNYKKLNSFIYSVKNQNGFNNACYDFFEAKNESIDNCYSKKEVRDMVENYPKKYPCEFMIIDKTFECLRFYVKVLDIKKIAENIPIW